MESSIVEGVENRARDQAIAAYKVIKDLAQRPLSVCVRSGWTIPGEPLIPSEYEILLCTGGPAVRIVGTLKRGYPDTASMEYQDWFMPWQVLLEGIDEEVLLEYARSVC